MRTPSRSNLTSLLALAMLGCALPHAGTPTIDRPVPLDQQADDRQPPPDQVMDVVTDEPTPEAGPDAGDVTVADAEDVAPIDVRDVVGEDAVVPIDVRDVVGEDAVAPIDVRDVVGEDAAAPIDVVAEDAVAPVDVMTCDAAVMTDPNNCGRCGNVCPSTAPGVQVCRAGTCIAPRSCRELLENRPALRGMTRVYNIDYRNNRMPIGFNCDMATDGGGWTVVFFQQLADETNAAIRYTVDAQLLNPATSTRMLSAYRNATTVAALPGWASFDLPTDIRNGENPFSRNNRDTMVSNLIVDGSPMAPTMAMLRYGEDTFVSPFDCSSNWMGGAAGRFCIRGTNAPFYGDFARMSSMSADSCSASDMVHNSQRCSLPDRVFSLAVR